jgi:hypothetical protein
MLSKIRSLTKSADAGAEFGTGCLSISTSRGMKRGLAQVSYLTAQPVGNRRRDLWRHHKNAICRSRCGWAYRLETAGNPREWRTLRRLLGTHIVATTRLPLDDGREVSIRKPSMADEAQQRIYTLLGIDWKSAYAPRKTEVKPQRLCSATETPTTNSQQLTLPAKKLGVTKRCYSATFIPW